METSLACLSCQSTLHHGQSLASGVQVSCLLQVGFKTTVVLTNRTAIGPVVAGFAVQAKGWRWGLWEIVWLNAPIMVAFLLFCPETSSDYILKARAARLRKLTGNPNIKSQSEINQAQMEPREVAYEALIKPVEIMVKDPAIAFTNLYVSILDRAVHAHS